MMVNKLKNSANLPARYVPLHRNARRDRQTRDIRSRYARPDPLLPKFGEQTLRLQVGDPDVAEPLVDDHRHRRCRKKHRRPERLREGWAGSYAAIPDCTGSAV
jgi:hypothetical protein